MGWTGKGLVMVGWMVDLRREDQVNKFNNLDQMFWCLRRFKKQPNLNKNGSDS